MLDSSHSQYELKSLLPSGQNNLIALITTEQNILIYQVNKKDLNLVKQLIGYNDEILDLCYMGKDDRFLAVATNSKNIKIYDTENNMNCFILSGHRDIVMSLTAVGQLLLSAGKDNCILLWELTCDDNDNKFHLTSIGRNVNSHTSTIGCIAFGYQNSKLFSSVCQDGSLKVWNLKENKNDEEKYAFQVKFSALAHNKEVNCVTFAPNNKILATASQDKSAKIWSIDSQAQMGTLRGHTRGVWCIRFSPTDQIILTSAADCSIRLWSLTNYSCLKRFEQECSILRAEFIDHGKFIISAASDGLLKIWNIKTNACLQTLDEHSDRIWALAVSNKSQKYFYSGAADSKLIRWQDTTTQSRDEEIDKRQELLQQEQLLQSLLEVKKHQQKAFVLALKLGKPKVSYNIVCQLVCEHQYEIVKDMITQLNDNQRCVLLEHVKVWSTNSRQCKVSNVILHHLLNELLIKTNPSNTTEELIEILTPYIQRHFKRVNELQKDLAFLEFIVKCI